MVSSFSAWRPPWMLWTSLFEMIAHMEYSKFERFVVLSPLVSFLFHSVCSLISPAEGPICSSFEFLGGRASSSVCGLLQDQY